MEIAKIPEDNLAEENSAELEKVMGWLKDGNNADFYQVLEKLKIINPSENTKAAISDLVVKSIISTIRYGQWGDLAYAKELLVFLGVENIELPSGFTERIDNLYARLTPEQLVKLRPDILIRNRHGKNDCLPNGKEYNEQEYAREALLKAGLAEEELTDEFVDFALKVRQLLILMHKNNVLPNNRLTMKDILALPEQAS